ncbi:hypothetical protein LSAT2_018702 [Lamellibrachia satsuma]|nr:hypothetical protein LSAT2_018702 [Lamellibrachia satsuma]
MKGYIIVIFLTTTMLTRLCFSAKDSGPPALALYRRCLKACKKVMFKCMKKCDQRPYRRSQCQKDWKKCDEECKKVLPPKIDVPQ